MRIPLRILIVEDSEDDTALLLYELRRGGYDPTYERVDSRDAMDAALNSGPWDIIVADHAMPQFSAPAALALLKERHLETLPFIIVSGIIGEDIAVSAMRAGAHDYIMKSDLARLVPAIQRELREQEVFRDRLAAQRALEQSEQRYRELFESAHDVIVMADRFGHILEINRRAEELTGYTREQLLAMNLFADLTIHADRDKIINIMSGHDTRTQETFELRLRDCNGQILTFEGSSSSVIDDARCDITMRCILRDISDRKRAEQDLAAYQSQLRSMALELTMTSESERRQIATALHDGIGQTLAITKLKLSTLRQQLTDPAEQRQLDDIRELIEDAIHDTRSLTFDLSPPVLYELGFEAAVEWLLDQMHERYGLACEFADDAGPRMQDDEVRVLLFRGVRELLMNVVKHAQAIHVRVTIAHPDGSIEVTVEDDGCGFDTNQATLATRRHDGFGLFTIRERLDHLGGRMQITSSRDQGTCVTITVPMNARVAIEGGIR